MKLKRIQFVAVVAVLALRLAACGGNPNGPSEGITLEGTVVGSSFSAASVRAASSAVLTVVVDGHPEMVATITNGSFTLRGLPEGEFTLIFMSDGAPIGTPLTFSEVKPNQALTVTVSITGSSVVLVEERRNGIGHGDLEIEGRVDQVPVSINPTGDNRFVIAGYTVIARPGQTSIRDGNRPKVAAELLVGQRVHVKGVWQDAATAAAQEVLAWEIKMQGDVPTTGPSPTPGATCMINGGRVGAGIELEGRVATGAYPAFTMTVNGNRASGQVSVQASAVQCSPASGPNAPTTLECQGRVSGTQRIHVRGMLTSCDLANALVTASLVTVQGN